MVVKKYTVDLNKVRKSDESMKDYSERMHKENKEEFGRLKPSELRDKNKYKLF